MEMLVVRIVTLGADEDVVVYIHVDVGIALG